METETIKFIAEIIGSITQVIFNFTIIFILWKRK